MAKKKSVKAATGLNAVYTEVARVADTDGLQVTGADTKRVLACFSTCWLACRRGKPWTSSPRD